MISYGLPIIPTAVNLGIQMDVRQFPVRQFPGVNFNNHDLFIVAQENCNEYQKEKFKAIPRRKSITLRFCLSEISFLILLFSLAYFLL